MQVTRVGLIALIVMKEDIVLVTRVGLIALIVMKEDIVQVTRVGFTRVGTFVITGDCVPVFL